LRHVWWLTGFAQLTLKIGDEIRGSTALAHSINDDFDSTSSRLKGTMNRMLRMAERTGIGWRVWAGFFAAVIFLFWYVWLF
jgi:blocked-early-in-transport protein 1